MVACSRKIKRKYKLLDKKKPRYYFESKVDPVSCYTLEYFIDELIDNNEGEVILFDAVECVGDGTFYCTEYGEVGLIDDSECGSGCEKYSPRNGRSGRCRYSNNCYEPGDRKFNLKLMPGFVHATAELIELHTYTNHFPYKQKEFLL